jgi:hypothetical protein
MPVVVSSRGALDARARAHPGQRQLAAEFAAERAKAPVLGGEVVAQHQRDVAARPPGAGQRERLRPQQARLGVDAAGDRAVVAKVEVDGDTAVAEVEAPRVERHGAAEAPRLGQRVDLQRPQQRPAAGDDLDRQHDVGGRQRGDVDGHDELDFLAGRQLGGRGVQGQRGVRGLQAVGERAIAGVAKDGAGLGLPEREDGQVLVQLRRPFLCGWRGVHAVRQDAAAVRVADLVCLALDRALAAGVADPQLAEVARAAVRVHQAGGAGGIGLVVRRRLRRQVGPRRRVGVGIRTCPGFGGRGGRLLLVGDVALRAGHERERCGGME